MGRERDDVVAPWDLIAAVQRRPDSEVLEIDTWCLAKVVTREPYLDPPRPARAPTPIEN